jgi:hypothetical protein
MTRQDWMTIVAGNELLAAMEAEQIAKVPQTGYGFASEQLCELQRKQAARGILGVEIVESNYGFSVRYDSGLQNWGLLASSKSRQLDGSFEAACKWAIDWVAQDPDRRYAWARK